MQRKRVTQIFPWLRPLRAKQRCLCFYTKMHFDGNNYAKQQNKECLPYLCYETKSILINENTGFDRVYQENKVFNLKLVAKTMDKLVIKPGETFSFWKLARYAEKNEKYKDGLCSVDGEIVARPGGGLCQMSNLLFWVFLHTPLSIVERHPHAVREFPYQDEEIPEGTDATVSEGWLDLKVRNDTMRQYQLAFDFDEENLYLGIYCDEPVGHQYDIYAKDISYFQQNKKVYQEAIICRKKINLAKEKEEPEQKLYVNRTQISYALPKTIEIGYR